GFSNVARDEHRHIAFGVRFLTDCVRDDDRYKEVIQKMLEQSLSVADGVIDPPWPEEEDNDLFGASREETHAFAAQCLNRRLKVIAVGGAWPRAVRPLLPPLADLLLRRRLPGRRLVLLRR